MYEVKSRCYECHKTFIFNHDDRNIAEKEVCNLMMGHYNSDDHKGRMARINGRKISNLKFSTSCGFCGEKFEISLDIENERITNDIKRNMERSVVQDMAHHMFNDVSCKTRRNRQDKILELIDEN